MTSEKSQIEPTIRASLLGPIEITVEGRVLPVLDWPRRAARSLLFMLLGSPGHRIARDFALETLWPDQQLDAAANSLYKSIHLLRRTLEPDLQTGRGSSFVVLTPDLIGLNPEIQISVDADIFERGLLTRSNSPEARRNTLRSSVALYRGEFLADEPYLDWPVPRREALRALWERSVIELSGLDRDADEPLATLPSLEALLIADPALELAHQAVIRAYIAAGDRDAAQKAYERCERMLADELDAAPAAETRELLSLASPPRITVRSRKLPVAPLPLVGRVKETERLLDLLQGQDARLVTLTGPGGIGKTRLATEIAWTIADEFPDGAFFVSLAPLSEPSLAPNAVAEAIGVQAGNRESSAEWIADVLIGKRLLLIIDNAEHLIEAVADLVSTILATAPEPRILVTSRERMHVRGEYEVALEPLHVADPTRSPGAIARSDAVALFTQVLRTHRADFAVTPENAAAIARVCARLEGIPLSLELAAARARHARPEALLTALYRPLDALTGGSRDLPDRQRSLRDAIAWSYNLLSAEERALFRALSVFAGGAVESAVEAVLPAGGALLDSLADKSLISWIDTLVEPRVTMLETIRAFAEEQARAAGEWEPLQARHAAWVLELAQNAGRAYTGRDQLQWSERLDLELANIRAAMDWCFAIGDGATAQEMIGSLMLFFDYRGHAREGLSWAKQALELPAGREQARINTLRVAGRLSVRVGDFVASQAYFKQSEAAAERLGDKTVIAAVLNDFASGPWYRGSWIDSEAKYLRALALCEELGNRYGIATSLQGLAVIDALKGDYALSFQRMEQAIEISREIGNPTQLLTALVGTLVKLVVDARYEEAEVVMAEALPMAIALQDPWAEASTRHGYAATARARGDGFEARAQLRRVIELDRQMGHRQAYALAVMELGTLELVEQQTERAAAAMLEAIEIIHAGAANRWLYEICDFVAGIAIAAGDGEAAARLIGFADEARRINGVARMRYYESIYLQILEQLDAAVTAPEREQFVNQGRSLSNDEAFALSMRVLKSISRSTLQ
jgi:predicted ATPase/DNA-binding SARP family transcriptional activator